MHAWIGENTVKWQLAMFVNLTFLHQQVYLKHILFDFMGVLFRTQQDLTYKIVIVDM